MTVPKVLVLNR